MCDFLNLTLYNYAFGGGMSGYDGLVPVYGLQIGVLQQVDDYLGNLWWFQLADPKALYVIWTGPDDFYKGVNIYVSTVPASITANVKTAMTKLYQRGARNFFIPMMPDLSITPSAQLHSTAESGYIAAAYKSSADLTTAMMAMLKAFAKQYPKAMVRTLDTLTYSENQYAKAAQQGKNVTQSCYGPPFMGLPGPVCDHPENYLFWDENHPTAASSLIFGEDFAKAAVAAPLPAY